MTFDDCRLCGTAKSAIDIFNESNDMVSLKFIIRTRLQITIRENDLFSHTICLQCDEKLRQIYEFSKKCQENQIRLSMLADGNGDKLAEQNIELDLEWSDSDVLGNAEDECHSGSILPQNSSNETGTPMLKITAANCDNIILPDLIFDREIETESQFNLDDVPAKQEKMPLSKIVSFLNTRMKRKSEPSNFEVADRKRCKSDEADPLETEEKQERKLVRDKKVFDLQFVEKGYMSDDSTCGARKYRKRKPRGCPDDVKCPYCGWLFPKKELENDHIHTHTNDTEFHQRLMKLISNRNKITVDDPTFVCSDCHAIFHDDVAYIEHRNEHEGRKPLQCHVCDRLFVSRKRLKSHMCTVHLERIFKCDQCSYRAKNAADIRKHKLGVHSGERIMCTLCGKMIAAYPHNMKKHMETHSEVPSYKCDVCNMAYKTNAGLQKHRENKHFPVAVMCSLCGMLCGSKQKYKKHLRKCRKRNAVEK